MPNGSRNRRLRASDLNLDPREIEAEIRRNRESNERFLVAYSAWFERKSTKKPKRGS